MYIVSFGDLEEWEDLEMANKQWRWTQHLHINDQYMYISTAIKINLIGICFVYEPHVWFDHV